MKKTLIYLLAITMFIFTSCSNNGVKNFDDKSADITLTTVSSPLGLYAQNYASGKDGCYEIIKWTDGTANILYNDLNSKTRVFLSSDVNSKHDTQEDTSFIHSRSEGLSLIKTDNYLYVIGRGSALESNTEESKVSYIQQRKLSGEVINTIKLPSNSIFNESGAIAFDGDNLYLVIRNLGFGQNGIVETKISLYTIAEQSFKLEEKYIFDDLLTADIIGVNKDKLILRTYKNSDDGIIGCVEELSVLSNDINTIINFDLYDDIKIVNEDVYILNKENKSFKSYNFNTKEYKDINIFNIIEEVDSVSFVADPIDNILFLATYTEKNGVNLLYALNTKTNEISKLSLVRGDTPLAPVGVVGDYLLVNLSEKTVNFWEIAPDGKTKFLSERVDYNYAWIAKEDYYNSISNYAYIDCQIEYR